MKQLKPENFEKDKDCSTLTNIELGPDSMPMAVAMCACNTTNCNLGVKPEMIGATMPPTITPSISATGVYRLF